MKIDICSFCNRHNKEVKKIISGYKIFICDFCISICNQIIKKDCKPTYKKSYFDINPKKIKENLDLYVIGQKKTKRILSVSIYNHYKRINNSSIKISKSNVLMIGHTGSGKTLLASTLAKYINVPFSISDATSLTEAGYVGEDVESILYKLLQISDFNVKRAETGIIYLDEIDKISKKDNTNNRDVSGEGVQQALLKIIEGTVSNIQQKGLKKFPSNEYIQINTKNILFIFGGVFDGINRNKNFFGLNSKKKKNNSLIDPKELINYGLIPEFVGRISLIACLNYLSIRDYEKILIFPKNSFIKQYQYFFKLDNIELIFSKKAIKKIAKKTYNMKIGARGLKYLLDKYLIDIMFYAPSIKNLKKIIINKKFLKTGRPKIIKGV
ncbi:ATP-dependent Clp protease ATP-binding subunit ClpX [Candidatus Vidania fulgoroideorum]